MNPRFAFLILLAVLSGCWGGPTLSTVDDPAAKAVAVVEMSKASLVEGDDTPDSGICPDCHNTGCVGDGRIMKDCGRCGRKCQGSSFKLDLDMDFPPIIPPPERSEPPKDIKAYILYDQNDPSYSALRKEFAGPWATYDGQINWLNMSESANRLWATKLQIQKLPALIKSVDGKQQVLQQGYSSQKDFEPHLRDLFP